jgi:predicted MFS family arabinose efflux permease
LGHARHTEIAVSVYLVLMCSQYSCSPGIYSLAMARSQPHHQSSVSALQNLVSCISMAVAAAIAGAVIAQFGYTALLTGASALALIAAASFGLIDLLAVRAGLSKANEPETWLQSVPND